MTEDQELAFRFLTENTVEYGRMLGYTKLREYPHAEWLHDMVMGHDDETIQGHRGAYKTTCLDIGLPVRMMLRGDRTQIFMRKTDDAVKEVIAQTKRILEHPTTQQLYYMLTGQTLVLTVANATQITTSAYYAPRGAAQLTGMGIGTSITGKHADDIWTDDIVNIEDRISAAERNRTRTMYMELQNIRNPGGRIFNTGTPWHADDAFLLMPKAKRYDCYSTGMLTSEELDSLRASMSGSLFAANYELRHIASDGALFATPPTFTDDESLIHDGIAHVDASYGGGDYTAMTCARREGDTIYIYGRLWEAHVDTVQNAMLTDCERLRCAPMYMETNGDKGYLAREMRAAGMPTRPYAEKENKYAKIATFLRKWWSKLVFLRGTDPAYIRQIMDFTDAAEHDDAPDSAACICRILDRRGSS